jgi:hypothetical protein
MNPGLASSIFNMLKVYLADDILGPQIAKLWGRLFNPHDDSGLISGVDTNTGFTLTMKNRLMPYYGYEIQ